MVYLVMVGGSSGVLLSGLHRDLCCGCSLESPRRGDSNGRPRRGFVWRDMRKYHLIVIGCHLMCALFLLLHDGTRGGLNVICVLS